MLVGFPVNLVVAADDARSSDQSDSDDAALDDFDLLDLGDLLNVVFSASKHEQDIGESPSATTLITREDIEASGANTLVDLLRLVPGMDVIITTSLYSAVTARMGWSNENQQFLVLIDGRDATMELLGFPPWDGQPILLEDVERIEIIRGPGSALYGANAMAGVVSIISRTIREQPSAWVGLTTGEVGTTILGGGASTRFGNWGISVGGGLDYQGVFSNPHDAGRRARKLRAVAEYRWPEKRRLLLEGGISQGTGFVDTPLGPLNVDLSLRTLRLAYESEDLRGQLYFNQMPSGQLHFDQNPSSGQAGGDVIFKEMTLATFVPISAEAVTLDGEVHWTLPSFWKPLLLIVGGGGRFSDLSSDQMLDGETFSNSKSSRYHEVGIDHHEFRTNGFFHGELELTDWVTLTGGLRLDYNTATREFLSPRLAAVFRFMPGQFVRLGVGRAFRKPAFLETSLHLTAEVPKGSPITEPFQFQEFMSRSIGNSQIRNEELLSLEVGYLGRFLDGRLSLALDLYFNRFAHQIDIQSYIVEGSFGIPDLDLSRFVFMNGDRDRAIAGSELSMRYSPLRRLMLQASWAHREVFDVQSGRAQDESPKNLITVGGRFETEGGLIGSLYVFTRSEFWDRNVYNPGGLMAPYLVEHMPNVALFLGRLGWRLPAPSNTRLEAGVKLFVPLTLSGSPHFGYREKGGGISASGASFGGEELYRVVSAYLEGSI